MSDLFPGLDVAPLHPLFVHLPLALWPVALGFWLWGLIAGRPSALAAARWLLVVALLAAGAAVATGLLAEEALGHDSPAHELVHSHKYWMIAASSLGAVSTLVAFVLRRSTARAAGLGVAALLLATTSVATLGGDRGALLVYGHGIGVRPSTSTSPLGPEEAHKDGHGH